MNLPVPVALNRFAAALRVFSLGIALLDRAQTTTIRPSSTVSDDPDPFPDGFPLDGLGLPGP